MNRYLYLLAQLIRQTGIHLSSYIGKIQLIIDLTIKQEEAGVSKIGKKLLRNVLESLTTVI